MSISLLPLNMKVEFGHVQYQWYLIKLDLHTNKNDFEHYVIRNDSEIHTNRRPMTINSSVFFNYRGSGAFGSVVLVSDDRKFLEAELHLLENEMARQAAESSQPDTTAGPSRILQTHDDDYSSSHSDWNPKSGESSDTEEEQYNAKKIKLESRRQKQGQRSSRGMMRTPSLKAEAVIPKVSVSSMPGVSTSQINNSWSHPAPVDKHSRKHSRSLLSYRHQLSQRRTLPTEPNNDDHRLTNENVFAAISSIQNTVIKLVQELSEMKRELGFRTDLMPSSPSSGFSEQYTLGDMNHHSLNRRQHSSYDLHHGGNNNNFHETSTAIDSGNYSNRRNNGVYDFVDEDGSEVRASRKSRKSKRETKRSSFPEVPIQHEQEFAKSSSSTDNGDAADMVPIGIGRTLVPKHIYNNIDWNSYTMATRKLLMAVFPRRTLATHSLTGKPSPAFMAKKPAKLALDNKKVNDIVITVVEKCRVKEGLVRSSITTKCADENKMYRMRQCKKDKNKKVVQDFGDQENRPPLEESVEESQDQPEAGCSGFSQ